MRIGSPYANVVGGHVLDTALDDIDAYGIREAREHHMARLKLCRSLHNELMFRSYLGYADSIDEALEDCREFLRNYRRMTTWRKANNMARMLDTKERIAVLRYFRRHGERIFARSAA